MKFLAFVNIMCNTRSKEVINRLTDLVESGHPIKPGIPGVNVYALTMVAIKYECRTSKRDHQTTFEAEGIEEREQTGIFYVKTTCVSARAI